MTITEDPNISKFSQYTIQPFDQWLRIFGSRLQSDKEISSLGTNTLQYLSQINPPLHTVIIEKDYVDLDYSAAFTHFYSYNFRPPPRRCIRFLFFSHKFEKISDIRVSN